MNPQGEPRDVTNMKEAELFKYLRETTQNMVAAVERLEALTANGEDSDARQDNG